MAYGRKATRPTAPTATGYSFGGWYTDKKCTTAYDFDTPVTANLTLYAKWTSNSSYDTSSGTARPIGPKTGDTGRVGQWLTALLLSGAGMTGAVAALSRSRRRKEPAALTDYDEKSN